MSIEATAFAVIDWYVGLPVVAMVPLGVFAYTAVATLMHALLKLIEENPNFTIPIASFWPLTLPIGMIIVTFIICHFIIVAPFNFIAWLCSDDEEAKKNDAISNIQELIQSISGTVESPLDANNSIAREIYDLKRRVKSLEELSQIKSVRVAPDRDTSAGFRFGSEAKVAGLGDQ